MNRRMVIHMLGRMSLLEAVFLLIPLILSLIFKDSCIIAIAASIGVAAVAGLAMTFLSKPRDRTIFAREGFVICALTWVLMSVIGALPFYFSGEIPSFLDSLFETVSGFTTTGSSILTDVESMSRSLLFWRSFTHFLGGMGVLVFLMMLTSDRSDRNIHIMKAEMPGPIVDKIVPRTKDTARILYRIYFVISAVEFILLWVGDIDWFEALIHTMSTAGTGGFGMYGDSITSFSPYTQWVITVFMFLFGMNFNLYFMILIKKFVSAVRSTELWAYVGIAVSAVLIITINICLSPARELYSSIGELIRTAAFQVSSIMTTTGFTTTDFNTWPELSKSVLIILMFIGACAGSTAGGIKVSRVIILFKTVKKELRHMLHPRSVRAVKFEGKKLNEDTIKGVNIYLAIYVICLVAIFLLLGIDKFDFGTNFVLTMTTFNNIGPAMNAFSAYDSLSVLSNHSKAVLCISMLLGRLEIFPLIITLSPATWSKKS